MAHAGALIERDEQDAAGAVLVDGDRLGRAAVRPRGPARLAALRRVPVAEGEVVEARGRDLGGEDHLVRVGLAGDRQRPVDQPTCQRARITGAALNAASGLCGARLAGKNEPVDDEVEDPVDDVRGAQGEEHQAVPESGSRPDIEARS